jgi:hypothetical protein
MCRNRAPPNTVDHVVYVTKQKAFRGRDARALHDSDQKEKNCAHALAACGWAVGSCFQVVQATTRRTCGMHKYGMRIDSLLTESTVNHVNASCKLCTCAVRLLVFPSKRGTSPSSPVTTSLGTSFTAWSLSRSPCHHVSQYVLQSASLSRSP